MLILNIIYYKKKYAIKVYTFISTIYSKSFIISNISIFEYQNII